MKNKLKYIFLLPLLSLIACSGDDYSVNEGGQSSSVLELHVRAGDFVPDGVPDTRATDNGAVTTFENGDRVGIIILDGNNNILANNVPYKYDGSVWSFDSDNGEGKSQCYYDHRAATYIVYFPYSKAADDVKMINELKSKIQPKANQGTKANYRASDLMTWSTAGGPQKSLNVELTHAYASVSFSLTAKYMLDDGNSTPYFQKFSNVSLTINNEFCILPYCASDGTYRYILPDGFMGSDIHCFYTLDKTYSNTITIGSVTANTRYTFVWEMERVITNHTLDNAQIGDFYCRRSDNGNGYLIPYSEDVENDSALKGLVGNDCIGIVYCVDPSFINSKSTKRGSYPHGLVIALKDMGEYNWYDAKSKVKSYDVVVPSNSSGWYLPNKDELSYICRGAGNGGGTGGKEMLNNQIQKVSGAEKIASVRYWSSTPDSQFYASDVDFSNGSVSYYDNENSNKVRYVLAF